MVDGTFATYPVRMKTYFHISREVMQTPWMSAIGRIELTRTVELLPFSVRCPLDN